MLLLAPSSITALLYATISATTLVQCALSGHQPRSRQLQHAHAHAHAQLAVAKRDSHAQTLNKRGDHYGKATFYNAETGNQGACGGYIRNSDWVVAIKGTMYGDYGRKSYWCEKLITITANGKTARNVRIGDACPGCPEGESLDMTPDLFAYFDNPYKGVIDIKWHLSSEDGDGGQQQQEEDKQIEEEKKKNKENEWKPLAPVSSIWKAPAAQWSPSPSSKKEEQKWTPPSSSASSSSSQQWTPSSAQQRSSDSSVRSNTWTPSATSSSMNATQTLSSNTTLAANVTLSNLTDVVGRLRGGNNTIVLPSAPGGLPPARAAGNGKSYKQTGAGNLHRAAQVVLDLAGLAYAASHSK